jgi:hypothetical protein
MIVYLIILNRRDPGYTFEWASDWLRPWGDSVTLSDECTTDKRQSPVILIEFADGAELPDEHFDQELVNDSHVVDYIIYGDVPDDDDNEEGDE